MFRDSDLTVPLAYYPCLPGVPGLPFPTAFVSQRWEKAPWSIDGVGEQYLTPTPYNGLGAKPTATGDTWCGTEDDFLNGPSYDPFLPKVIYANDGLPLCCHGPVGVGGMSWSGAALASVRTPQSGHGGLSWRGTAGTHLVPRGYSGHGGLSWTGSAAPRLIARASGEGGVSWSGHAGSTAELVYAGEGGVSWSGEALAGVFDAYAGEGGVSWSGEAVAAISGPGPTCDEALVMTASTLYSAHHTATVNQWFSFLQTSGTLATFTILWTPETSNATFIWTGSCDDLHEIENFNGSAVAPLGPGPLPYQWFVEIIGGADGDFTLRVDVT